MKNKYEIEYYGFEHASDLERDMSEIFDKPSLNIPNGEWNGILRITIEYIPSEDEG